MQLPTIHMNGTSAQALYNGYRAAGSAVRKAIEALEETAPNARDYYLEGEDAFDRAVKEHAARVHALREVLKQTSMLAEGVAKQGR